MVVCVDGIGGGKVDLFYCEMWGDVFDGYGIG